MDIVRTTSVISATNDQGVWNREDKVANPMKYGTRSSPGEIIGDMLVVHNSLRQH